MKYKSSIVIFVVCLSLLTACGDNNNKAENSVNNWNQSETEHTSVDDQFVSSNTEKLTITTDTEELSPEDEKLINEDGMTLESRILVPAGYQRTEVEEGSLGDFLHQYPMKAYGSKVHLFDGSEKYNQSAHISVFDLPIENYDLQQCADSVIRMYAEYFWNTKQYERILIRHPITVKYHRNVCQADKKSMIILCNPFYTYTFCPHTIFRIDMYRSDIAFFLFDFI